ncbi:MAG: inositol 2-dehydrogenase [Chloroflexi bacterium]|nr:inositol 2-dehydrogenase [Chloroflexota bacterium]
MKFAVIGAGRIGQLHASHLAQAIRGAELVAVVDVAMPAAEETAARWAAKAYPDLRSVLAQEAIDAVCIASATETHIALIEEAAAAGLHIFCEKPIDHDLARIDRALAAVQQAGVLLQVGFNRRFDANAERVRAALLAGEIGEPYTLHLISRDPAPPTLEYLRGSGGIFLDMMIHDFDMARFLIGAEVESVFTLAGVRVDPRIRELGDLDTALVSLRFSNGVIGMIDNCRQAVYGYDQRIELFGSKGSIRTDHQYANSATLQTAAAIARDLPHHFFIERYRDSYVRELEQFIAAIESGQPPPVTGMDGRIPVVLARAARLSYDENRPVNPREVDG